MPALSRTHEPTRGFQAAAARRERRPSETTETPCRREIAKSQNWQRRRPVRTRAGSPKCRLCHEPTSRHVVSRQRQQGENAVRAKPLKRRVVVRSRSRKIGNDAVLSVLVQARRNAGSVTNPRADTWFPGSGSKARTPSERNH